MLIEVVAEMNGNTTSNAFDLPAWRLYHQDRSLVGCLGDTGKAAVFQKLGQFRREWRLLWFSAFW